jgi:hypothetical protein
MSGGRHGESRDCERARNGSGEAARVLCRSGVRIGLVMN